MENEILILNEENETLKNILCNINGGFYEIENIENIRITNKLKPDFVILCVEADTSENIVKFFESNNFFEKEKNKIVFEKTFFDFVVVSLDKNNDIINSSIISLFELIIMSDIMNLEDSEKWALEDVNFVCYEINKTNKEKEIITDMNIMG